MSSSKQETRTAVFTAPAIPITGEESDAAMLLIKNLASGKRDAGIECSVTPDAGRPVEFKIDFDNITVALDAVLNLQEGEETISIPLPLRVLDRKQAIKEVIITPHHIEKEVEGSRLSLTKNKIALESVQLSPSHSSMTISKREGMKSLEQSMEDAHATREENGDAAIPVFPASPLSCFVSQGLHTGLVQAIDKVKKHVDKRDVDKKVQAMVDEVKIEVVEGKDKEVNDLDYFRAVISQLLGFSKNGTLQWRIPYSVLKEFYPTNNAATAVEFDSEKDALALQLDVSGILENMGDLAMKMESVDPLLTAAVTVVMESDPVKEEEKKKPDPQPQPERKEQQPQQQPSSRSLMDPVKRQKQAIALGISKKKEREKENEHSSKKKKKKSKMVVHQIKDDEMSD